MKFTIRRKTLNKIYIYFPRPVLEYTSVVWGNCTLNEKDRLDKFQIGAGRIVAGHKALGTPLNLILRNNDDFMLLQCRTDLFENSCVPSLISLWNNLPLNVRYLPSISSFKREISNIMFQTNTGPP